MVFLDGGVNQGRLPLGPDPRGHHAQLHAATAVRGGRISAEGVSPSAAASVLAGADAVVGMARADAVVGMARADAVVGVVGAGSSSSGVGSYGCEVSGPGGCRLSGADGCEVSGADG
jgi:hypothetical protein